MTLKEELHEAIVALGYVGLQSESWEHLDPPGAELPGVTQEHLLAATTFLSRPHDSLHGLEPLMVLHSLRKIPEASAALQPGASPAEASLIGLIRAASGLLSLPLETDDRTQQGSALCTLLNVGLAYPIDAMAQFEGVVSDVSPSLVRRRGFKPPLYVRYTRPGLVMASALRLARHAMALDWGSSSGIVRASIAYMLDTVSAATLGELSVMRTVLSFMGEHEVSFLAEQAALYLVALSDMLAPLTEADIVSGRTNDQLAGFFSTLQRLTLVESTGIPASSNYNSGCSMSRLYHTKLRATLALPGNAPRYALHELVRGVAIHDIAARDDAALRTLVVLVGAKNDWEDPSESQLEVDPMTRSDILVARYLLEWITPASVFRAPPGYAREAYTLLNIQMVHSRRLLLSGAMTPSDYVRLHGAALVDTLDLLNTYPQITLPDADSDLVGRGLTLCRGSVGVLGILASCPVALWGLKRIAIRSGVLSRFRNAVPGLHLAYDDWVGGVQRTGPLIVAHNARMCSDVIDHFTRVVSLLGHGTDRLHGGPGHTGFGSSAAETLFRMVAREKDPGITILTMLYLAWDLEHWPIPAEDFVAANLDLAPNVKRLEHLAEHRAESFGCVGVSVLGRFAVQLQKIVIAALDLIEEKIAAAERASAPVGRGSGAQGPAGPRAAAAKGVAALERKAGQLRDLKGRLAALMRRLLAEALPMAEARDARAASEAAAAKDGSVAVV